MRSLAVCALGKRHHEYQATLADYAKVANALLLTLEEFLGNDFTAEVRDAWTVVFGTISGLMIEGSGRSLRDRHESFRSRVGA